MLRFGKLLFSAWPIPIGAFAFRAYFGFFLGIAPGNPNMAAP